MPARGLAVVIVVFWLGMTGWMFYQDVLPSLQPGVPPPYTIDLVDEAGLQQRERNPKDERPNEVLWVLNPDGKNFIQPVSEAHVARLGLLLGNFGAQASQSTFLQNPFVVRTWVVYREKPDDSFAFHLQINPRQPQRGSPEHPRDSEKPRPDGRQPPRDGHQALRDRKQPPHNGKQLPPNGPQPRRDGKRPRRTFRHDRIDFDQIKLEELHSWFRVNRAGQLLDMGADLYFDLDIPLLRIQINDLKVEMDGEVREGHFYSKLKALLPPHLPALPVYEPGPVAVSHSGLVLNPMHPVNRIKGLRPGQRWRMPLIDPLVEALGASTPLLGRKEVRYLNAHVLPEPQLLPDREPGSVPIPCLVIAYDDEDSKPLTWVQLNSGLVLRQEATQMGKRLVLQRQTIIPEP